MADNIKGILNFFIKKNNVPVASYAADLIFFLYPKATNVKISKTPYYKSNFIEYRFFVNDMELKTKNDFGSDLINNLHSFLYQASEEIGISSFQRPRNEDNHIYSLLGEEYFNSFSNIYSLLHNPDNSPEEIISLALKASNLFSVIQNKIQSIDKYQLSRIGYNLGDEKTKSLLMEKDITTKEILYFILIRNYFFGESEITNFTLGIDDQLLNSNMEHTIFCSFLNRLVAVSSCLNLKELRDKVVFLIAKDSKEKFVQKHGKNSTKELTEEDLIIKHLPPNIIDFISNKKI